MMLALNEVDTGFQLMTAGNELYVAYLHHAGIGKPYKPWAAALHIYTKPSSHKPELDDPERTDSIGWAWPSLIAKSLYDTIIE